MPPQKYFSEHPEYYSLIDGERNPAQLCLTNPEVVKIAAENVKESLKAHPNSELISVSANDQREFCTCKNCWAIDKAEKSPAGALIHFVNEVAKIVEKDYTNVFISTLAYHSSAKPPKTLRPHRNVAIRFCTDSCMWERPFVSIKDDTGPVYDSDRFYAGLVEEGEEISCRKFFLDWTKIHDRIHVWDYPVNYSHFLAPMPNMQVVADNIRFFAEHGATGIMEEGPWRRYAERGNMRAWVYAKLLWNPRWDVRKLMQDFIWGYYGKAAPTIADYNELLQRTAEEHKPRIIHQTLTVDSPRASAGRRA